MAIYNGLRACQAAGMTEQAMRKEGWAIIAPRRLQYPRGARAHARRRPQSPIHTNTLAHLRCGAKMRATAIQVTMTHEGDLYALRDGAAVRPEVGRRQFHLGHSVRSVVCNHLHALPTKTAPRVPVMLSPCYNFVFVLGQFFFWFLFPCDAPNRVGCVRFMLGY